MSANGAGPSGERVVHDGRFARLKRTKLRYGVAKPTIGAADGS